MVFFVSGLKNLYRSQIGVDVKIAGRQSLLEILFHRLAKTAGIAGTCLVMPKALESAEIVAVAQKLDIEIFYFDESRVIEKPLSLRQQRWNLEDDSGCEEWLGAPLLAPINQHKWSEIVLVPLENLLVDADSVGESLRLYFQESFEICFSSERQTGANWSIFSSEVLQALMQNHEDLMWARGGLAWVVRKPLYPFNTGFYHCPRIRPRLSCDLRLNSQRTLQLYKGIETIADPDFSYGNWLEVSGWEKLYTDFAPANILVEPSAECKADCLGCPQPKMQRNKGFMSGQTFSSLLEGLQYQEDFRFIFSGCGEPLLNPDFSKMLEQVAGSSTMLVTSLQQLPPENLSLSALDHLRISVDALEEKGFARARSGCNWRNVEQFIAETGAKKKSLFASFPELGVTLVRSNFTETTVLPFLQYWKKVAQPVFNDWFFKWPFDLPADKMQWFQILGENSFLGQIEKTGQVDFAPVKRRPCRHALLTASVLWDGSVTLCPFDTEGRMIVGNVNQFPLLEIWRSDNAKAFREAHINQEFAAASKLCENCSDWYHNL